MTTSTDRAAPAASRRARLIVFEGIDGSGKTTLSNAVAAALRAAGRTVAHVREGGSFASVVTTGIREFGRDAGNVALSPHAELFIYLAREVQLFDEATGPALATADVVIADRFFYTAELLATAGRGLPAAEVTPIVDAATRAVTPDLVVVVDVDPHLARARRKVSKVGKIDPRPPSRKGLAGVGLQHRMREGYRSRAAREPERWIVVENTEAELATLVDGLTRAVLALDDSGVTGARACVPAARHRAPAPTLAEAAAAFAAWLDDRAVREPALTAHWLAGLAGPEWHARRLALCEAAPLIIAGGLRNLADDDAWALRHRLAATAPGPIARGFVGATDPLALAPLPAERIADAAAAARALVERAPREVASALWGRDDELAWELRAALTGDELVRSVGGVGGARAWAIREAWLAGAGGHDAWARYDRAHLACGAVGGLADDRAWAWRKAARTTAPISTLASLWGVTDDRAWRWRAEALARAPKTVLASLAGLDDDRAWTMREATLDRCPEALDSARGLDLDAAWRLRERGLDRWPIAAVKSLGPLALTERGRAILAEQLVRLPDNLALWRSAALVVNRAADDDD